MSIEDFTYSPEVYNTNSANKIVPLLIEQFHPGSVLDIGCGKADWLRVFMNFGIVDVMGVDGPWVKDEELQIPKERYYASNLEQTLDLGKKFDLALCLETAEHLEEKYAMVLIDNLTRHSDTIIFSAAIPGQPGEGHINLQVPAYWSQKFQQHGFNTYDSLRPILWDDKDIQWWYRQNMFIASRFPIEGYVDTEISTRQHEEFIELKKELEKLALQEQLPAGTSKIKRLINRIFKK